jgi:hypothetical protein
MKLPGMVLFLLVAWLRNTCNLSEKIWWKPTHLFSCKIVDFKLAESASETCLRVWILLWPVVYVLFLNVHAAADHWNKNHISWGRCWREVWRTWLSLIVSKDGISLYGDCFCWYVCWENGHLCTSYVSKVADKGWRNVLVVKLAWPFLFSFF